MWKPGRKAGLFVFGGAHFLFWVETSLVDLRCRDSLRRHPREGGDP